MSRAASLERLLIRFVVRELAQVQPPPSKQLTVSGAGDAVGCFLEQRHLH